MHTVLTDQFGASAELWMDTVGDLTVLHTRTRNGEDQECLNLQPWEAVHLAQELLLHANAYLGGDSTPFDLKPEDTVARVAEHLKDAMKRKDQELRSEREKLATKIAAKDEVIWDSLSETQKGRYRELADIFKVLQNA